MSNKIILGISNVQSDLASVGISKDQKNTQQHYAFRGIDDVYNTLSRLLAKHKVVIYPVVKDRSVTEKQTRNGGVLFYTVLTIDYHFVSAEDGSEIVVTTIGEAMDSADKSTNKAMSAGYKYACIQTFAIPTKGDNDADATTHDVVSEVPVKPEKKTLTPENKVMWSNAIKSFQETGNLKKVLDRVKVSKEHQELIMEQASA